MWIWLDIVYPEFGLAEYSVLGDIQPDNIPSQISMYNPNFGGSVRFDEATH